MLLTVRKLLAKWRLVADFFLVPVAFLMIFRFFHTCESDLDGNRDLLLAPRKLWDSGGSQPISMWIKSNGLKMNVAKTQLMVLNRKSKDKAEQIQVKIDGTELNKQCSVRYLGVHIDKDLTWKVHVNYLRQTCLARLAMIRWAGHHHC